MLCLVTGGAGFIGSHLSAALAARGDRVRVFDNFDTGSKANLSVVPSAEVIEGDVRDLDAVRQAMRGVTCVFHQAALVSVPRSVDDPILADAVNTTGTLNVLQAARSSGVQRVVYASSSAIYGMDPSLPKHERLTPAPITPYAVSKLAGEHYCATFREVYGFEAVALRYFNVFGPRQSPFSQYAAVIPKFIHQLITGEQPTVNGDGSQTRDFIFVDDVVRANLAASSAPNAAGMSFNIATGTRHSLLDLLAELGAILGVSVNPRFNPPLMGDIPHSYADIGLARRILGFEPTVSFREGLERTVASFKRSGKP